MKMRLRQESSKGKLLFIICFNRRGILFIPWLRITAIDVPIIHNML
jgi:hypothetical protein